MTDYDKLRAATRLLEELRAELAAKLATGKDEAVKGETGSSPSDLHSRVSKALKALSGQS